ncbi:MAG TPA: cytochrome P450 [Sphingobium sp.]|uniref:cytochrome P450 n=1 Tax=Sphingobium sp. TaxID=1912891 RepID=UPI002ED31F87
MANTLTAEDPRYARMFNVTSEALESSGHLVGDISLRLNALRDQAPAMKGSLLDLLDLPEIHQAYNCERDHYTLLSFDLVERGFRENLLFSSHVYNESPGVLAFGNSILRMIGDEHRRYRAVVQPMFLKPKAMSWWRPQLIDGAVETLVSRFEDWETVDLNMELCARLPVHVVTRMIGMDGEDALHFRENLHISTVGLRTRSMEEVKAAAGEVARMLKELIVKRRAEPGEDVISALANNDFQQADGTSRKLTDDEVFGYCRLIMLAGGGTTWRQPGITIWALLTHYPFWEACRDDRSLLEKAIEEGARWLPTDPTFPRLMTEDTEVGGVLIPKGARVDLCVGSANRDPARWENPDQYDIFRKPKHHVGFGLGPHQCLGMNVAKQEMISALNALMDRFPDMMLDPDAPPPEVQGGLHQRGMTSVPVRLHPKAA